MEAPSIAPIRSSSLETPKEPTRSSTVTFRDNADIHALDHEYQASDGIGTASEDDNPLPVPHITSLPTSAVLIRFGVCEDQGGRSTMEDESYIELQLDARLASQFTASTLPSPAAIFAVFDGHGGTSCARFLKQHLLTNLTSSPSFPAEIPLALKDAFVETDRAFHRACQVGDAEPSGSTAVVALLWGERLWLANAGDSRAVLCRRGKAVQLTMDHRPSLATEHERVTALGGYVCPDGFLGGELAVTRALGDWHLEELKDVTAHHDSLQLSNVPDVFSLTLKDDDEFIILACDGLWDVMTSHRVVELARLSLRSRYDAQQCAESLVEAAKRAHATDNLTVVVICLREQAPTPMRTGGSTMPRSLSQHAVAKLSTALEGLGGGGMDLRVREEDEGDGEV